MFILISGLPGAGKSSLADAVESVGKGYTHVPLDKYIREVPDGINFLDWVALPECIDWPLLQTHLQLLTDGVACFTPSPDWSVRGKRRSVGGSEPGGRFMKPATSGYLIPGCHAFAFEAHSAQSYRVFVQTPRTVLVQRLTGRSIEEVEAERVLDEHLSPNWREIEAYADQSNLVLSGVQSSSMQIQRLLDAMNGFTCPAY